MASFIVLRIDFVDGLVSSFFIPAMQATMDGVFMGGAEHRCKQTKVAAAEIQFFG